MIWKFITFLVRKLEPEIAHQISLIALKLGFHPRLKRIEIPVKINNLHFTNFLGVAAGFDKNAQIIQDLLFDISNKHGVALVAATHDNNFIKNFKTIYKIEDKTISEI